MDTPLISHMITMFLFVVDTEYASQTITMSAYVYPGLHYAVELQIALV